MGQEKHTLGQAIDQAVQALEPLDEGARKTALAAVCTHLHIDLGHGIGASVVPPAASTKGLTSTPPQSTGSPIPPAPQPHIDIRALKDAKKPASAKQMACVVGFYLQEHAPEGERKETISASDLQKYFKQAGFKLPQRLQQVLPDAKASGYFDSGTRGEYKLNAVGYNLVAHNLPSSATEN